jgi:hypothetical protein
VRVQYWRAAGFGVVSQFSADAVIQMGAEVIGNE